MNYLHPHHHIIIEELCGSILICADASHTRGSVNHNIRRVSFQNSSNNPLITKIESLCVVWKMYELRAQQREMIYYLLSKKAMLTCNPYTFVIPKVMLHH